METIRGEYWIIDGQPTFADGNISDYNHESIAEEYVLEQLNLEQLAKKLKINTKASTLNDIFHLIINKLIEKNINPIKYLNIEEKLYKAIYTGNIYNYVIEHDNWIAVRENNIELFDFLKNKQNLIKGIENILDEEDILTDDIELYIYDFKNNKAFSTTLEDIKNQSLSRIDNPTHNKDIRFNIPNINKQQSVKNKWTQQAQKHKIIPPGHELWRFTSESFQLWLEQNQNIEFNIQEKQYILNFHAKPTHIMFPYSSYGGGFIYKITMFPKQQQNSDEKYNRTNNNSVTHVRELLRKLPPLISNWITANKPTGFFWKGNDPKLQQVWNKLFKNFIINGYTKSKIKPHIFIQEKLQPYLDSFDEI